LKQLLKGTIRNLPALIGPIIRNYPLVFFDHQRRREDEIGGSSIAGDRDVPDDGYPQ
jgi:hypothetical protein